VCIHPSFFVCLDCCGCKHPEQSTINRLKWKKIIGKESMTDMVRRFHVENIFYGSEFEG